MKGPNNRLKLTAHLAKILSARSSAVALGGQNDCKIRGDYIDECITS